MKTLHIKEKNVQIENSDFEGGVVDYDRKKNKKFFLLTSLNMI